jgi:O-antigen/teichoic acid export membrane protein
MALGNKIIPKTGLHERETNALSIHENFSWTFAGNVVYAGSQWGILVVLAKLGTPEMLGRFALGLAVTAPVIMFSNLHLRAVQATDAKYEYTFGDYLGLRIITTLSALLVIVAIVFFSGYRGETAFIILAIGAAKGFEAISDVFFGLLQQHERMDRIAKSMMIKGPLSIAALGMGVYLTEGVLWGVVGLAVVWAVILLSYDIKSAVFVLTPPSQKQPVAPPDKAHLSALLWPRWDIRTIATLAWLALPLGFVMGLLSLNTNIPRYFIEKYHGQNALGNFVAMAYFIVAGNTVVSALGQSASPRLAKFYAVGNRIAFRKLMSKLLGTGVLLGGVGFLIVLMEGKEILALLYSPEYAEYTDVFVWLMLAAGISYVSSILGYGMTAARYFRVQLFLLIFTIGITIVISFWLIPSTGLRGAAFTMIAATTVQGSCALVVIFHALRNLGQGSEKT